MEDKSRTWTPWTHGPGKTRGVVVHAIEGTFRKAFLVGREIPGDVMGFLKGWRSFFGPKKNGQWVGDRWFISTPSEKLDSSKNGSNLPQVCR